MGTKRTRTLIVKGLFSAVLLASALPGCGGAGDPAPSPLGRHFEDTFLASVPLDQRKDEINAKQAYDIATLEKAKAEADFNDSRVALDVAKNERDAARLDEKSAESRAKAAQQSADMNRIAESDKEIKGAKAAREAADKRYEYLVAYREWLKRLMRYTQHNAYWRESQYELAQARVADKAHIQPKGFKVEDYVKQEADRAKKVQDAKGRADSEKQNAMGARSKWLAIQGEADKLLGKKSEFPDPMAPNQVKGVNPDAGAGGYTLGTGSTSSSGSEGGQPVQDPTMPSGGDGNGSGSGGQ